MADKISGDHHRVGVAFVDDRRGFMLNAHRRNPTHM